MTERDGTLNSSPRPCSPFLRIIRWPPPVPSITIHILHDNTLSPDSRDKFSYLAGRYGQLVKFYNVEELCADDADEIKKLVPRVLESRYSIATFYRFFIPKVLPSNISKAIYLDADIIVNLDINELYRIDLGDKALASVPDIDCNHLTHERDSKWKFLITNGFVAHEDYFVAGVLVLNLDRLRIEDDRLREGLKFLNQHPEMSWFDQDILNYLYSKDYVKVDEKFDVFVTHERWMPERKNKTRSAIYHYVVGCLNMNMSDTFNRLWMSCFIKTPFFDVETIGRMYDDERRLHDDLKAMAVSVSASVTGKNRAFYIEPQKIGWLKKLFAGRDDEIFLPAENNEESLQALIDTMKIHKGKTVFFIITARHMGRGFPFDRLNKEGFVESVDYIKGWLLLSGRQGVPHQSHALVKML